ncbi:hypothetical protein ABPG77_001245 [Micractinium sp. CCAP 211/92]
MQRLRCLCGCRSKQHCKMEGGGGGAGGAQARAASRQAAQQCTNGMVRNALGQGRGAACSAAAGEPAHADYPTPVCCCRRRNPWLAGSAPPLSSGAARSSSVPSTAGASASSLLLWLLLLWLPGSPAKEPLSLAFAAVPGLTMCSTAATGTGRPAMEAELGSRAHE